MAKRAIAILLIVSTTRCGSPQVSPAHSELPTSAGPASPPEPRTPEARREALESRRRERLSRCAVALRLLDARRRDSITASFWAFYPNGAWWLITQEDDLRDDIAALVAAVASGDIAERIDRLEARCP